MTSPSRADIARDIVARDAFFAPVVARAGLPPARRGAPVAERFPALVRSITFQLLATSAANTIHARVADLCGGDVTPASVMTTGVDALRGAGLNATKAGAMYDLAQRVADGDIRLDQHGRLSNEDITKELTVVRGVGPWTVQMYLMHTMGRRDVWPVGDYGVRNGWSLLHGLPGIISERDLRVAGDDLVGVRSDVAWYCWQAVHFHRLDN